jgi:probable F420-dependent oxidoreductase
VLSHPFRFAVTAPPVTAPVARWVDSIRMIESMGFDTVVIADHFTQGYDTEPLVGLTAAAMATERLRIQTGVLGVDYRHPVLTHRMAATLDVVSGGRLTLGLGAGWMTSDYEAAGIPYDPAGTRVGRLEEAVTILKGLFTGEPFTFTGQHYSVRELSGLPAPVQQPHPPFFIGGGGPRMLGLAGREAAVVGINANLGHGALGRHAVVDFGAEAVHEKIRWARDGAAAAGRQPDDVELSLNSWLVRVVATPEEASAFLDRIAARVDVPVDLLASSPSVLVGTVSQCVDLLVARRETFGFNRVQLDAGFAPDDLAALAPVVAALAGT